TPVTVVTPVYLEPIYIAHMPLKDGWVNGYQYAAHTDGSTYAVRSGGKDGINEGTPTANGTTSFNSDIIFANGQFTRYPDGVQK
ncbi:MAG: type II secretion system protein GspG, partial [Thermoanaerobaculia bacterium]